MAVKLFKHYDRVGLNFRHRGVHVGSQYISKEEAIKLRNDLIKLFPITVHAQTEVTGDRGDRIKIEFMRVWESWDEVPAGVIVETLGEGGTTSSGDHDRWLKRPYHSVPLVSWAEGGKHRPFEEIDCLPGDKLSAPYREWRRKPREWKNWADIPFGIWVENRGFSGRIPGTSHYDRYRRQVGGPGGTIVEIHYASDRNDTRLESDLLIAEPNKRGVGPFREVLG